MTTKSTKTKTEPKTTAKNEPPLDQEEAQTVEVGETEDSQPVDDFADLNSFIDDGEKQEAERDQAEQTDQLAEIAQSLMTKEEFHRFICGFIFPVTDQIIATAQGREPYETIQNCVNANSSKPATDVAYDTAMGMPWLRDLALGKQGGLIATVGPIVAFGVALKAGVDAENKERATNPSRSQQPVPGDATEHSATGNDEVLSSQGAV